jgi:hypothetical protein
MVERKAYHRAPRKRDVVLFTSILRLHCQPPPPYKIIAELLLKTWPEAMRKLAKDVSRETQPEMLASESRTKEWLAQYLQERYELAEEWGSEPWTTARDKDRSMVEEILRVTGLKKMGYEVMDKEEMRLQMKWKKEGDWRYRSTPEPFQTSSIPPRDISKLIVAHSEPQVPTTTKVAREIFQVLNSTGHNNSP